MGQLEHTGGDAPSRQIGLLFRRRLGILGELLTEKRGLSDNRVCRNGINQLLGARRKSCQKRKKKIFM